MPNLLSEIEVIGREAMELWAYVADGRVVFDRKTKGRGQGAIRMDGSRAYLIKRRTSPQAVEIRPFERVTFRAWTGSQWITFTKLRPAS